MLSNNFIPKIPFEGYKWKWGTLQCTEGINDPIVLLGVLRRMRKVEQQYPGAKFSSNEFAGELLALRKDIPERIMVDLGRSGERNIIRNSGQYWRALGLIPLPQQAAQRGRIELTQFGKKVADNVLSQAEFAAITVSTFSLPNVGCMSELECRKWEIFNLKIYPLRLILSILDVLYERGVAGAYITPEELYRIVIPLSGCCNTNIEIEDYAEKIVEFRHNKSHFSNWPDCIPAANDHRIVREFLLFLRYYGYLLEDENNRLSNDREIFRLNVDLLSEIRNILQSPYQSIDDIVGSSNNSINQIASDIEHTRSRIRNRPHQARFRRDILNAYRGCIVTNVEMHEILEAAHIVPFAYNGEDTIANGFAMRTDIHILFDSGHLRISPDGDIMLSDRARMDYGRIIPPKINIPNFVNKEFIRWRWDNPNSI